MAPPVWLFRWKNIFFFKIDLFLKKLEKKIFFQIFENFDDDDDDDDDDVDVVVVVDDDDDDDDNDVVVFANLKLDFCD